MKLAIMQPYFLPYIGYWQLINAADKFVIYDNIQYTKKGWINRNRILKNGEASYITVPLKDESDFLDIKDRHLADSWSKEFAHLLRKIQSYYKKAPYFTDIYPIIEKCIKFTNINLFEFTYNSIIIIKNYLEIDTVIEISSNTPQNPLLKNKDRVINLCQYYNADTYINSIGGTHLYDKSEFKNENINLFFIKSYAIIYKQFYNEFIPWLSILDVMMFNSKEEIKLMLTQCSLV